MSDKQEPGQVSKREISPQINKKPHNFTNLKSELIKISEKFLKYVDYSIDFITKEQSHQNRSEIVQIARKPILFGIWVSFITFIVCGIWSGLAPINSAAVAQGTVLVESERKVIQHLEGGIVNQILVKNGDVVKKGQTLIVLDDTRAKTAVKAALVQLRSLKASYARLLAESEEKNEIDFSSDLKNNDEEEVIKIRETQNQLFQARKAALFSKLNSIEKKIEQHKKMIISYQAQLKSNQLQLQYNQEQLNVVQKLIENGQATKPRMLELQSKLAYYEGNMGDLEAKIAQANSAISGEEVEMISSKTEFLNKVIQELKEVQIQMAGYEEDVKYKSDTLARVNITAPQDGIVNNLQIHTIGGVISHGGQALLEIIPQDDQLVIDAQIRPEDIDLVNEGLTAKVKLLAYKSRTTPSLDGTVTHVSAETVPSRIEGGRPYYHATIKIDSAQYEKKELAHLKLYPGMPAQVFIVTGSRTLLRYILDPVIDSMRKAFRER